MIGINPITTPPSASQAIIRGGEATQKNVVPALDNPSLVTPEDINTAVDFAEQQVNAAQETQADAQDTRRGLALQVNQQQHQQDLIDTFIAASTGEDVDSGAPIDIETLVDISRSKRVNQFATAIGNSDLDKESFQTLQQQSLQEKIQNTIGEGGRPPTIQVVV